MTDHTSREALLRSADDYLSALIRNDPSAAPLAAGARSTENGIEIPIGHGLWSTATGLPGRPYVQVVDVDSGGVALLTRVEEVGEVSLLGLRLRVADHGITEVESLVVRPKSNARQPEFWEPDALATPLELYDSPAPAARTDLIAIADDYLDAIGEGNGAKVHNAPHAVRRENGFQTVGNPDAPEGTPFGLEMDVQIGTGFGAGIVNRDRRYLADPERGVVWASFLMEFEYSVDTVRKFPNGWLLVNPRPTCMYVHEVWKVVDGRVTTVDSIFDHGFYGMGTGW